MRGEPREQDARREKRVHSTKGLKQFPKREERGSEKIRLFFQYRFRKRGRGVVKRPERGAP